GGPNRVWLRRVTVLGGTAALTLFAVWQMMTVLGVGGLSPLKVVLLSLFAVNFAWIALTFASALAGWFLLTFSRPRGADGRRSHALGRTAVVMPTYNEQPDRVFAAV